jgi:hypothetical protein
LINIYFLSSWSSPFFHVYLVVMWILCSEIPNIGGSEDGPNRRWSEEGFRWTQDQIQEIKGSIIMVVCTYITIIGGPSTNFKNPNEHN